MIVQPTPKGGWKITFLLFLFMLVNFADKIVVGLAGVPIMTELKLEPDGYGCTYRSMKTGRISTKLVIAALVGSATRPGVNLPS